jgi:hypothetical protein
VIQLLSGVEAERRSAAGPLSLVVSRTSCLANCQWVLNDTGGNTSLRGSGAWSWCCSGWPLSGRCSTEPSHLAEFHTNVERGESRTREARRSGALAVVSKVSKRPHCPVGDSASRCPPENLELLAPQFSADTRHLATAAGLVQETTPGPHGHGISRRIRQVRTAWLSQTRMALRPYRLRAGNRQGAGSTPGGYSETTAPDATTRRASSAWLPG